MISNVFTKKRVLTWFVVFVLAAGLILIPTKKAEAGTQTFVCPSTNFPTPINFTNGSFQTPTINYVSPTNGSEFQFFHMSVVPGWSTVPVDYAAYGTLPEAYYIELQRVGTLPGAFASTEADGDQYAELNCNYPGRLYQNAATVPGTTLLWRFAHRALGSLTTQYDQANFYLRPAGTPTVAPTSAQLIQTALDDAASWHYYNGIYTIPVGQTSTEFAFESVSSWTGNLGNGNFLDDITLQTGAKLFMSSEHFTAASGPNGQTAYLGETIIINQTTTNMGETDASRCVWRNIFSDGLEYVLGSVTMGSESFGAALPAGNLAIYNSTTDELRINIGEGATVGTANTNGGKIEGSINDETSLYPDIGASFYVQLRADVVGPIGSLVKNQVNVSYNNGGWESFSPSGYIQYSFVVSETPNPSDETTYVNQFTIVDRSIHGTVWYDADADGMMDASETRASGLSVGLYWNGDTTYTTPANDVNGNPLVTTTDVNGDYTFQAFQAGTFQVVLTTPDGYKVTLKTTTTDNDAVESGTHATVKNLALTTALSTSVLQDTITDVDIGLYPDRELFGLLWYDANADGMLDSSESRIPNWTVGVYPNTATTYTTPVNDIYGNPLITTTNTSGLYSFEGIPAGIYKVVATTPEGYYVTLKTTSTLNDGVAEGLYAVASDANLTSPTPVGVQTPELGYNFGFANSEISGRVWYDDNYEGTIDATEPRISGITVTLYNGSDTTFTTPATDYDGNPLITTTNANGEYTFTKLLMGTYKAVVTTPEGSFVTVLANDNDAVADETRAIAEAITLTSAMPAIQNVDLGFVYNTQTITITKLVRGAASDPNKEFDFQIRLADVYSTLPYTGTSVITGVTAPPDGTISSGFETVSLRHGQSITIQNVPYGTAFNISEILIFSGYSVTITETNGEPITLVGSTGAEGTATDDVSLQFDNTLNSVVPTGVWFDVLPYIVIAVLAAGSLLIGLGLCRKGRRRSRKRAM